MSKTSPTARTLIECRRRGWPVDIVERRVGRFTTKDLFGFGDILALDGMPGSLIIQATSGGHGAARVLKIVGERAEEARAWLEAGNRVEVWAWRKLAKKIDGRNWHPKVTKIELEDLCG